MGWGGMAKGGVPDRWEDYTNKGTQVKGTHFVPFKVPLNEDLLKKVRTGVEKWGLDQLVEELPQLGLVIDLTNTSRYYQRKKLEEKGVQYCKIFTKGHEVPDKGVVEKFFKAVESIEEKKLIGVHCTHGLNRTGYLICRYMVEKMGIEPEVAIHAFDLARGHKQERENYLQHLRGKAWETEAASGSVEIGEEPYRDRNERSQDDHKGKSGKWSRNKKENSGGRYSDSYGNQNVNHYDEYQNQGQDYNQGSHFYEYHGQHERRGYGDHHGGRRNHQGYNHGYHNQIWGMGYSYNNSYEREQNWDNGYYQQGGRDFQYDDHRDRDRYYGDGQKNEDSRDRRVDENQSYGQRGKNEYRGKSQHDKYQRWGEKGQHNGESEHWNFDRQQLDEDGGRYNSRSCAINNREKEEQVDFNHRKHSSFRKSQEKRKSNGSLDRSEKHKTEVLEREGLPSVAGKFTIPRRTLPEVNHGLAGTSANESGSSERREDLLAASKRSKSRKKNERKRKSKKKKQLIQTEGIFS